MTKWPRVWLRFKALGSPEGRGNPGYVLSIRLPHFSPEPQLHLSVYFNLLWYWEPLWASHSLPKCFTTESHSLLSIEFPFSFLETGRCHVVQVGSQLMTVLPQPLGTETMDLRSSVSLSLKTMSWGCFVFFPNTSQLLTYTYALMKGASGLSKRKHLPRKHHICAGI